MTMVAEGMLRAAVAAVGLLVACKGPVPPVPGKGGPPWIELTSPHFTVWTDADLDWAHELIRKMERLRVILAYAVFPTAPVAGRDLAIVLRDDAELKAFSTTDQARAFALPAQSPLWQPVIVLSASSETWRGGSGIWRSRPCRSPRSIASCAPGSSTGSTS
jgi:hypothetical protein